MLPAEVYSEIASVASKVTSVDFVEIGTAHGAATIALWRMVPEN